jgi:hypothetical protein
VHIQFGEKDMIKEYKVILIIIALFLGTFILASPSSARETDVRSGLIGRQPHI